MKRNSFKSTFFIKKNQLLKNGEAPVMLRITVNSLRAQLHTKHSINPDLWSQAKECSRARDAKSRELNDYIEASKSKLRDIFLELEQDAKIVTAEIVKNKFFGLNDNDRKTLVGFFNEHNEQCRKLIGIDCVDITVRRYECCARYLREYIREKYMQDDLLLREINGEFVKTSNFWLFALHWSV